MIRQVLLRAYPADPDFTIRQRRETIIRWLSNGPGRRHKGAVRLQITVGDTLIPLDALRVCHGERRDGIRRASRAENATLALSVHSAITHPGNRNPRTRAIKESQMAKPRTFVGPPGVPRSVPRLQPSPPHFPKLVLLEHRPGAGLPGIGQPASPWRQGLLEAVRAGATWQEPVSWEGAGAFRPPRLRLVRHGGSRAGVSSGAINASTRSRREAVAGGANMSRQFAGRAGDRQPGECRACLLPPARPLPGRSRYSLAGIKPLSAADPARSGRGHHHRRYSRGREEIRSASRSGPICHDAQRRGNRMDRAGVNR